MNHLDSVTASVPNLWTDRHAWLMYGLVRWLRPVNCVEVGAYAGFSSMHIARALEDMGQGHLWCIDDYSLGTSAADIHNNLVRAGVASRVTLVSGKSREVEWPKRVDFAFIDGDHSFDGCRMDCDEVIRLGARCVCIHDTQGWWGPAEYLEMFREQSAGVWDVMEGVFDSGFAVLLKREPKNPPFYTEQTHPAGVV